MTGGKVSKSWGWGCVRQALLAILVFLIFLLGFIGLVLFSTILPLTQDQRVYLWLGGFVVLLLMVSTGIFMRGNHLIRQRAKQLDAAFNSLGLVSRRFLWNGRQYHGMIEGRQVDVYFFRGPSLDIYFAAPLNTRMGVGLKGTFSRIASRMINRPELKINDPRLAHLGFYPLDEAWGGELLELPQAKSVIMRLVPASSGLEFRNLLLQPEAIHLQIHHLNLDELSGENARAWLSDLQALALIAGSLPAPTVTASASPMEHRTRVNRSDITLPLIGITCGILGLFAAILIIILVLFFNLSRSGI